MPIYLGIDPGANGGIAWSHADTMTCEPMPATQRDVWDLLCSQFDLRDTIAVIERQWARPAQSTSAMFKFGVHYGFLQACLTALDVPYEDPTPRQWMKALHLRTKKKTETPSQWKNYLKQQAQQRYPDLRITKATSDAILIATYCRQQHFEKE